MISEKSGDFMQWLRGFYFTVKKGGVGAASLQMGRTQSSISHQIKCLEEDLGIQLFDRSRRSLELTEEGVKVLNKAIQIFDTVNEMKAIVQPGRQAIKGQINIAGTHAILLNYLPKLVTRFMNKFPKVSFLLDSGSLSYIMDRVGNAEADLGIACPNFLHDNLAFLPLFETHPVLIGSKKNNWNIPAKPKLKDIAHLPFISFPTGTSIEYSISKQFSSMGNSVNTVLKLTHFEHVKSYVEMGVGISILDAFTLTEFDQKRLSIYQLQDFIQPRVYGMIIRKNAYLRPSVKAFHDELCLLH